VGEPTRTRIVAVVSRPRRERGRFQKTRFLKVVKQRIVFVAAGPIRRKLTPTQGFVR
jgi:hypothetical protein